MNKGMRSLAICAVLLVAAASTGFADAAPASDAVLQANHSLSEAMAKGDKATIEKLLDTDFTATDSTGKTRSRAEVIQEPSNPADGEGAESNSTSRMYGDVALILSQRGPVNIGRVWVKRDSGWRLLVYQGTKFATVGTPAAPGGTDCENPCRTLPYQPKNAAEQGIVSSWQALETAVTHHDAAGWAPHVADDFLLIGSMRDHPFTKQDRIDILNKQKANNTPSAPAPLVSAKMYDFGPTVVMTAMHQPMHGNPVHVVRIWVEHNHAWQMAFSQQTGISNAQNAAAK